MKNIDFFSEPPKIFIFQKKTNQNTFGGFLFIFYMIIMLIISSIYIFDYILNSKYSIEYSLYKNTTGLEMKKRVPCRNDLVHSDINPIVNISFELYYSDENDNRTLSERFQIIDDKGNRIKRGTFIQRKVTDILIDIIYLCDDRDCALNENDTTKYNYCLEMRYDGFVLDHQSDSSPLKKNENIIFKNYYIFDFDRLYMENIYWETIKYKEERGLLGLFDRMIGNKNEYISGFFTNSKKDFLGINPLYNSEELGYYKTLNYFNMINEQTEYIEYRRKKISILDIPAKLGSLFTTLYYCFFYIFKFYSRNFDNYKIIKRIISNNNNNSFINNSKSNKKNESNKQLDISIYPSDSPDIISVYKLNSNPVTNKELNFKDLKNNNINKDNNLANSFDEKKKIKYEKMSFILFCLNDINSKFGCKCKGQELINISNQIMKTYFSIESILYNQIIIDNLLKDYKWNKPDLKNIENNELIFKLLNNLKH